MDILEIEGIGKTYKKKLEEFGINTVEEFLNKSSNPAKRKKIADVTKISEKLILKWAYIADLMRIDGIGEEYSELLQMAGVNTVKKLSTQNADALYQKIIEINSKKDLVRKLPKLSMLSDWIDQAKKLPAILETDKIQKKTELLSQKRPISLILAIILGIIFLSIFLPVAISGNIFGAGITLLVFSIIFGIISIILAALNHDNKKRLKGFLIFLGSLAFIFIISIVFTAVGSSNLDIPDETVTGNQNNTLKNVNSDKQEIEEIKNNPPTADAGEDIECYAEDEITLTASNSYDPDNDKLTYTWIAGKEEYQGETLTLIMYGSGTHYITLTASDGKSSDSDMVKITVKDNEKATKTEITDEAAIKTDQNEEETNKSINTGTDTEVSENIEPEKTFQLNEEELTGTLKVHFIDVGQGDASLIQTPEGNIILIDGGPASSSSSLVSYLKSIGVSKINIVVATHPHEDHIGGLISVLNSFAVDNIIDSGVSHTTKTYENYLTTIQSKNINFVNWSVGQSFDIGNNISIKILGPTSKSSDLNNSSIVLMLSYINSKFLFTGDAEGQEETKIISSGVTLKADVLKVGHHGSSTSCCMQFLNAVDPLIAIISCGAGNSYGHPHEITLESLTNIGANIYRTDLTGTIVIESDGENINVTTGTPYTYVKTVTQETTQAAEVAVAEIIEEQPSQTGAYVGSIKSDVFHKPDCRYVKQILPENIIWFSSREDAIAHGYRPCKVCKP